MGGVELRPARPPSARPTVTYDMTTLQHLRRRDRYLVSLNSDEWIDRRSVIASFDYAHPVFDLARDRRPATLRGDRRHSAACTTAARGGVTASTRTGWCRRCACATGSARSGSADREVVLRVMRPGAAALCDGTVWHHRTDPGRSPLRVPGRVRLARPRRARGAHVAPPALVAPPTRLRRASGRRLRRRLGSPAQQVRACPDRRSSSAFRPSGAIRMLTQVRRWGWLFNPITVYVAWDRDPDVPVAIVLEVTNTPWRERHHYVAALQQVPHDGGNAISGPDRQGAARLAVPRRATSSTSSNWPRTATGVSIELAIDAVRPGTEETVLETAISLDPRPVTRHALGRSLAQSRLAPTHRVSIGIYVEAMRLWRRGVMYVPHPSRRAG